MGSPFRWTVWRLGARSLAAERLERGVVLELAGRVVLVLHRVTELTPATTPSFGLVGESCALRRLREEIRRVAALEIPILLRGATGTGKELVAAAIHRHGARRDRPFLALNMAAVPASLAAAELFGAARGAYTGATQPTLGFFRRAAGGTLFLDEIGEAAGRGPGDAAAGARGRGPYELGEILGEGGMGRVYRARDRRLGRQVAIKHVCPDRFDDHAQARLRREALLAGGLAHPAIVRVYDLLETAEGDWIVMELVEGSFRSMRAEPASSHSGSSCRASSTKSRRTRRRSQDGVARWLGRRAGETPALPGWGGEVAGTKSRRDAGAPRMGWRGRCGIRAPRRVARE